MTKDEIIESEMIWLALFRARLTGNVRWSTIDLLDRRIRVLRDILDGATP